MKEFKLLRLDEAGSGGRTRAQVVRVLDGANMLSSPRQLSFVKRCVKDFNDKTEMGVYLLGRFNDGFPALT